MISVRCSGKVWWMLDTICTAVSVFPVPGGPTTTESPGFMAAFNASTCIAVNRTGFIRGASSGYGPAIVALYGSTTMVCFAAAVAADAVKSPDGGLASADTAVSGAVEDSNAAAAAGATAGSGAAPLFGRGVSSGMVSL